MPNSGVLLIDKPTEMTSHDLVNIARKVFQTKKIGHNGTLDPDATGVMVLCVGQATRLNEYLTADDKRYRATLRFGGNVVATCALPTMDEAGFRDVLTRFVGKQEQTPPLYSAIKKDGKPLYRYAREGLAVDDIPKREIEIYALECLSYNDEEAVIDVHCSKGTYIRTLCQDIARACGSCGCMSALRRTAAGAFTLDACLSVEALRESADPYALLLPMSEALTLPQLAITSAAQRDDLMNGRRVRVAPDASCNAAEGWVQAVQDGELLAIGHIEAGAFIPKKVFHG